MKTEKQVLDMLKIKQKGLDDFIEREDMKIKTNRFVKDAIVGEINMLEWVLHLDVWQNN